MRSNSLTTVAFTLLIVASGNFHTSIEIAAQQVVQPTAPATNTTEVDGNIAQPAPTVESLESNETETANFSDVVERVQQEVACHGSDNVLLVVDIDNTTLAMDQPLGSDQWYNWQYNFIFQEIQSPDRVAKDLGELLGIQGTLFALGKMHPPEPELPPMIRDIQNSGCCSIVLTSRGPEFRNATERELKRNGYDYSASALEIAEPVRGSFLPYDKNRPNVNGLSKEELDSLRDPRPISYSNGIMMTAGQHKGYMLRTLLARSKRTFRAVVFVDDHKKHTTRMTDAFKDSGITTACFHYVREQPNVDVFEKSDKKLVAKKWKQLSKTIRSVFEGSDE